MARKNWETFAELVMTTSRSQAECYRLAYPNFNGTMKSAAELASRLIRTDKVASMIDQGRQAIIDRIAAQRADLAAIWESTMVADRNEISELRIIPCRYCWGIDNKYQETPSEHQKRRDAYDERALELSEMNPGAWRRMRPFDERGGVGYTIHRRPNPECAECFGVGKEMVVHKDTRDLSPEARMIYEGIGIKNGLPAVITRSRADIDDRLAKMRGIYPTEPTPPPDELTEDEPVRLIAVWPDQTKD